MKDICIYFIIFYFAKNMFKRLVVKSESLKFNLLRHYKSVTCNDKVATRIVIATPIALGYSSYQYSKKPHTLALNTFNSIAGVAIAGYLPEIIVVGGCGIAVAAPIWALATGYKKLKTLSIEKRKCADQLFQS